MLWFSLHGIGAVWLGGSKVPAKGRSANDIIPIAFGVPEGPIHRTTAEFKRKEISMITNDLIDPVFAVIRLAPSGINLQPWYFEKGEHEIKVYEQILKPPYSFLYKLTAIDMDIALCHSALAIKEQGKIFEFTRTQNDKSKKGFRLFGKIRVL